MDKPLHLDIIMGLVTLLVKHNQIKMEVLPNQMHMVMLAKVEQELTLLLKVIQIVQPRLSEMFQQLIVKQLVKVQLVLIMELHRLLVLLMEMCKLLLRPLMELQVQDQLEFHMLKVLLGMMLMHIQKHKIMVLLKVILHLYQLVPELEVQPQP